MTPKTKTIMVHRLMPEWRKEVWLVPVPIDTPEDDELEAALDAMYDGEGVISSDTSEGYIDMLDGTILHHERTKS